MQQWEDRVVSATCGNATHLGCILLTALDRPADDPPRFVGKASVTSDGFIMCGYVDRAGDHHPGAFVGSWDDLEANLRGLSRHLALDPQDHAALFATVQRWIGLNYAGRRLGA